METEELKQSLVAKINEVAIVIVGEEENDRYVPVKPICQILGIAFEPQFEKIKKDSILSPVVTLRVTTGADGKQYQMQCLPYKYIFGWLFTINSKNVKEEAREAVDRYKKEVYDVLYLHFTEKVKFLKEKNIIVRKKHEALV